MSDPTSSAKLGTSNQSLRSGSFTSTGYALKTFVITKGSVDELREILEKRVDTAPEGFFTNAPIVLDISEVSAPQQLPFDDLKKLCREHGLFLLGLSGITDEDVAKKMGQAGIPVVNSSRYARVREENFKPRVITKTVEVEVEKIVRDPEPMLVIRRNVRSGESIQAPGNSVTVLGSVSRGARIIASHHVIVLGDLLGEVYAGSPKSSHDPGTPQAFIYCGGRFGPTFVAIAGNYQTADDMEHENLPMDSGREMRGLIVTWDGHRLNYIRSRDFTNQLTQHTI